MRLATAVVAALAVCLGLLAPTSARADEIAPGIVRRDLATFAEQEVQAIVRASAPADRQRLVGIYAAIDPDPSEPRAQPACDDDGDPVVVFSEAMLELAGSLATASLKGEDRVEEYAAFTARTWTRGARWSPLPARPGEAPAAFTPLEWETRLREILLFVAVREIARITAGELTCPHPTPTREQGDAIWTRAEALEAMRVSGRLAPDWPSEAPFDALRQMKRGDAGGRALLAFVGRHTRGPSGGPRSILTYEIFHPLRASPGQK